MTTTEAERPPIANASISLVLVPSAAAIDAEGVVRSWVKFLQSLSRPCEVLVVSDTSDELNVKLGSLGAEQVSMRILQVDGECVPGKALAAAIATAQYPLLAYVPCDRQFVPGDLQRFLNEIDKVDAVTGYRVAGAVPSWLRVFDGMRRWLRRIILGDLPARREAWLGWKEWRRRWLARWIFGLRVQDPLCSFRLFRREVFRRIPIQSHGPMVHLEILAKANHLGALFLEVPVAWTPPDVSESALERAAWRNEFRQVFRHPDFSTVELGPAAGSI